MELMMIMSMGCRLLPPVSLLVISQVIYEHKEPWWNDIDKGILQIRPPELSCKPANSHLVAKQEKLLKEMMNLVL
jgi:hypothetical protein